MAPQQFSQSIYPTGTGGFIDTTTTSPSITVTSLQNQQLSSPFPIPAMEEVRSPKRRRLRDWFADLRHRAEERRQDRIAGLVLPLMQGAAQEVEVEKTVEHKKKIVLERTVGIPRDKGSGEKATHTGKVTLVRSMDGTPPQKAQVGIKVEPNGSGHVEIPMADLREALDELEPDAPAPTDK